MGKLIFLVSVPRAGKSTWADDYSVNYGNCVAVNADSFRLAISNDRWNYLTEKFVFATEMAAIRAIRLANPYIDIIKDDCHNSKSAILDCFSLDEKAECKFIPYDVQVCHKRAIDTGQPDLIPVIENFHKDIQKLCEPEPISEKRLYAVVEELREWWIKNRKPLQRIV
jgi:hypothetical protein